MNRKSDLKKCYAELIGLTRLYLLQEHQKGERIATDPATLTYFRQIASSKKLSSPTPLKEAAAEQQDPLPCQPFKEQPASSPLVKQKDAPILQKTPVHAPPPSSAARPRENRTAGNEKHVAPSPNKRKHFIREPQALPPPADLSDIHQLLKERFPGLKLEESIPSDSEAKKILNAWKHAPSLPSVLILSHQETPKEKTFLENLAHAIGLCHVPAEVVPARLVEENENWEASIQSGKVKLVITRYPCLAAAPKLMKNFREFPKQGTQLLGTVPVYILSDLAHYMREPQLKRDLWKVINDLLAKK